MAGARLFPSRSFSCHLYLSFFCWLILLILCSCFLSLSSVPSFLFVVNSSFASYFHIFFLSCHLSFFLSFVPSYKDLGNHMSQISSSSLPSVHWRACTCYGRTQRAEYTSSYMRRVAVKHAYVEPALTWWWCLSGIITRLMGTFQIRLSPLVWNVPIVNCVGDLPSLFRKLH